jgi:hypothetical protein
MKNLRWRTQNYHHAEARAKALHRRFAKASGAGGKSRGFSASWIWLPLMFVLGISGAAWHETQKAQAGFSAELNRTSPVFRYCRDTRAAGYGPILLGQPGYAVWLDADRDGIACEWN